MHPDFSILAASWDGLDIKYIHSENLINNALIMYVIDSENFAIDWFDNTNQNPQQNYLEISFSPSLFKDIFGQKIPNSTYPFIQLEITDPSMLYLAHLLQIEMEAPKILSQKYVLAIVTALIVDKNLRRN